MRNRIYGTVLVILLAVGWSDAMAKTDPRVVPTTCAAFSALVATQMAEGSPEQEHMGALAKYYKSAATVESYRMAMTGVAIDGGSYDPKQIEETVDSDLVDAITQIATAFNQGEVDVEGLADRCDSYYAEN